MLNYFTDLIWPKMVFQIIILKSVFKKKFCETFSQFLKATFAYNLPVNISIVIHYELVTLLLSKIWLFTPVKAPIQLIGKVPVFFPTISEKKCSNIWFKSFFIKTISAFIEVDSIRQQKCESMQAQKYSQKNLYLSFAKDYMILNQPRLFHNFKSFCLRKIERYSLLEFKPHS